MKILGLPTESSPSKEKSGQGVSFTTSSYEAYKSNDDGNIYISNLDDVFRQAEQGHKSLAKAKKQIEEAEAMLAQVAREFQSSNATLIGNEYEADYQSRQRVTWNTDELEAIFHDVDKLPEHVKKSLRVDKEAYEKLPEEMKNILAPARIVNPQKPKINVRRK
tara:strand:- start:39 stop:527 length:489 start_codon:yes stop_codon:yes gene_type:complete